MNSAGQIPNMGEACLMQDLRCFDAPLPHLADRHNILIHIEFIQPLGQLGKRDQLPANI